MLEMPKFKIYPIGYYHWFDEDGTTFAQIKMLQRVPLGFHACCVNGDRLLSN